MKLKGHIVRGFGHFEKRMTNYRDVFTEACGRELFPGTLNVVVNEDIRIREDFRILGTQIGEPEQVLLFEHCRINGVDAFRIRPCHVENKTGGHGDNVLEIACSQELSGVGVGAEAEVEFFREEITP